MFNNKNPYFKIVTSNVLVDAGTLDWVKKFQNPYGTYWQILPALLLGVSDIRARSGKFTTPWNAPSNPFYSMPKFKFIDDTFSDLLDRRAIEIFSRAKNQNKRVALFWSGGIDSTCVLVSFLKNLSKTDCENFSIICNINSILENYDFYLRFISNKIHCMHYNQLDVNNDLLDKYILIHGDPGDCLFGPSISMYRYFIDRGEHLEPWRNHLNRMAELLDPTPKHGIDAPGFGRWYVDKITRNLEESGQSDYISTIADWWWWTYYNFKWEFSCQRPFFYTKRNFDKGISIDRLEEYSKNVFFNTEKFQQWTYSNLKNHVDKNFTVHKKPAKDYIFEFTKDDVYKKNKIKTDANSGNFDYKINFRFPIVYDQNWVGYRLDRRSENSRLLLKTIHLFLENYKG